MIMTANDSQMRYRRFGRTGLNMPVFSCGGMRYQDGWNDKPMDEIDPAIQENLEATIHRSLEVGINHIETARGYGPSERQLGQLLPKLPREELIVQTKVGPDADADVFVENVRDSIARLQLESVDLFAIHGINTEEKLEWSLRPGGCFDAAVKLQKEGLFRFIGFSTHGTPDLIKKVIAHGDAETGKGFDYMNLHWYYIYQSTWPAIAAAAKRDIGVFIISPSDKGGLLYKAPPLLHELCDPLHPMTFNDLFCLSRNEVHTLSIGAARPSDFNEHLDALPFLDDTHAVLDPILKRLAARYDDLIEPELRNPWALSLPPLGELPGGINVRRILQLRNLAKAFDMHEYGKFRYNLMSPGNDYIPGERSSPEKLDPVRADLASIFNRIPGGEKLMTILEEADELFGGEAQKRLTDS